MTCEPEAGLVQMPCFERKACGAVKAITAAPLALKGDGTHVVPLDAAIETVRETGRDMHERYKGDEPRRSSSQRRGMLN